ncbi:MAG: hypothetical protein RR523_13275 [Cetobacterium sp.]|uniref:hypothetical protein n=1 Tax=unclassified Cetobacterium TaxID=2630983 RepID=UPI00163BC82E|nr:hypothetical protein [Cetobacterium sp. 8H]MBC2849852.1 hypothetical protein [Cetobacterium sp. 8H]MBC2849869.1 hypothetical protein [Cetobacterium sp. 8H]
MKKIRITQEESNKLFKLNKEISDRIKFLAYLINVKSEHLDDVTWHTVERVKELSVQIYHMEEYFKNRKSL